MTSGFTVFVTGVSFVAVAANIMFVWPQALRILRSRNVSGVSAGTWTISVSLFSVWAAYAISTQYWALAVANVSCLIAAITIMVFGTVAGWPRRWAVLAVAGVFVAGLAGVYVPLVLAAYGTVAGVALRVPQLVALIRAPDVSGVSATTWVLSGATAGAWLIVSVSRGATAVAIANSTALIATVILLGLLQWRKRTAGSTPNVASQQSA